MEARWPERCDCALLTSKGYASRAARDMIDLLGDSDRDLQVFCIHDADASGTRIYRALRKATAARPERKIEIINLGLDPWEALDMGLEVEKGTRKSKKLATIADLVKDPKWRSWLLENRVELNAMSTPQFLHWLEKKFTPYAGKVVSPKEVLQERIVREVRDQLRLEITNQVLSEADVDGQVELAFRAREHAILGVLPSVKGTIERHLREYPADLWANPVPHLAMTIAIAGGNLWAA